MIRSQLPIIVQLPTKNSPRWEQEKIRRKELGWKTELQPQANREFLSDLALLDLWVNAFVCVANSDYWDNFKTIPNKTRVASWINVI